MMSSSGLSILIQFVFFTILARIYSPAVYGIFGIFNLYTTTLGNASTLGYNQAFVIPKEDREFSSLLRLTIWIAVVFSVLTTLLSFIAGPQILAYFDHEDMGVWVYFIGPTVLLMAFDRITSDWAIRNKEFKGQVKLSVGITLVTKIFNALFGWLVSATAAGLVFTTLLQYALRAIGYSIYTLVDFKSKMLDKHSWSELFATGKKYKEFPLYIYWGNVINIFSNSLPAAILVSVGFTLDDIGFYSYSLVMLDMPIRILGSGIYSVFSQKAAELVHGRMSELAGITWKLYRMMTIVCLFFSATVYVFGEKLYLLLLAERWGPAGRLAEVLIIFYFFRMISTPLSALFGILKKESQFFVFQIILSVARIITLYVGVMFTHDFIEYMFIYSMVNAVIYFIFCVWIFRLLKFSTIKVIMFTASLSSAVFFLAHLLKVFVLN
jgi:O-antigen/teichoic acid export membrane protein